MNASLAMVTNKLHPSNHLANGEEPEDLGDHDASGHELGAVDVAGLLQEAGSLVGGLLGGLGGRALGLAEEGGGVLHLFPQGLEVGLEGRDGTGGGRIVSKLPRFDVDVQLACEKRARNVRRSHLLAAEDDLADLKADF